MKLLPGTIASSKRVPYAFALYLLPCQNDVGFIRSDENKKNMARKVTEMLCLKENCFDIVSKNKDFRIYRNQDHYLGIVYYYTGIKLCKIAIKKLNKPIDVYVFSLTDDVDYDDFKELGNTITLKPTPFWHGSKYNANAYGTRLLDAIVPGNNFNFPKSVYAVLDCIDMFLPEDGIVLDFFAGSGTTGHAVLKLNHEYGGSRSFVLCTNNENNIATDTCLPRIRNVMNGYKHNQIEEKGLGGELIYYKTTFIDSIPSDENKKNMARKVTEMLCLKENCFDIVSKNKDFRIYRNQDHYLGIVYYYTGIKLCKIAIKKLNKPIDVYVFSLTDDVDYDDFKELGNTITLKPIPAAILNVYKRLFGYVRTKTVSRKTCETTGRKNHNDFLSAWTYPCISCNIIFIICQHHLLTKTTTPDINWFDLIF